MKTAAKITVGITALAAVATVAAMLMFWREVVVQYHCFQLQRDPSYLLRIVEEPVDSLAGVAVREFVRTPGGGKELLMCYTTYVTKHVFPSLGEELETTADIEGVALAYDDKDVFDFELRTSNMSYTGGIWLRGGPDKWSVLEQMQTLFPLVPEVGIVCVANSPY